MKALTVRQPWAWAILGGGKDVENRKQLFTHRGLLAIHAGRVFANDWALTPTHDVLAAEWVAANPKFDMGAVVGVVDLIGAHRWSRGCCTSPWAERAPGVVHLMLAHPRRLAVPLPVAGKQGVWNLPSDVERAVLDALTPTA